MTILEFCEHRKVQASTVAMYIKRNPDLFEGHTSKKGKHTELDAEALEILNEKYPMPPEIVLAPNAELVAELDRYKDLVIALQQEAIQREKLLAKAELDKQLLEEREVLLIEAKSAVADLQGQNADLHEEIGSLKAQLAAAEEKASKASQEAEKLRSRSLWQRIFNT